MRNQGHFGASGSIYIDFNVYEIINNFKAEAKRKKIQLKRVNLKGYGSLDPSTK